MKNRPYIIVYIIALMTLVLDQVTKYIVINNLQFMKEVPVIKNFFSWYYVRNSGAAFSSFLGNTFFLIAITIVCLILVIGLIQKDKYNHKLSFLSLGILLGGMIGNLIDRIIYNSVIDFIFLKIYDRSLFVCNIADIGITVGIFLYIIISIIDEIKTK